MFQNADLPKYYATWHDDFVKTLTLISAMSDQELLSPEGQETLWRARGVSGIGPGEAVNVAGAYDDPEIARQLFRIKSEDWGETVGERATRLQAHAESVLELVNERHSSRTPHAKLARVFAVLHPQEATTCFSWQACQTTAEFILGHKAKGLVDGGVRVAHRVQAVLNTPLDPPSISTRSRFVWWLFENRDDIRAGTNPGGGESNPMDLAPLALWTATRQYKGVAPVKGFHEAYRAVLRAAQGGASVEDIVATLEQDLGERSAKSRRSVFNLVRRLELLKSSDGLWYPSDAGEELLESDPPDVLVQMLLVRQLGPAHLLRRLKTGATSRKALTDHLSEIYPNWTTSFAPNTTIGWCAALGLVESTEQGIRLTPYGESWEARLPDHLPKVVTVTPDVIDSTSPGPIAEGPLQTVDFDTLWTKFAEHAGQNELVFFDGQVRTLHSAWHFNPKKRFVLLSGLSGTGKTRLLCEYARTYCELLDIDPETHVETVPVSPDWRDPTGLFGYFNALHADPTFQPEPALQLLLRADKNPTEPYFLILDEMNLARVERYFAPCLSAMETGSDLAIHAQDEIINGVPPKLGWPRNLFIGGTVNMDETTHAFSDKVLDRAFTLEFWEVDLPALFERRHAAGKQHPAAENILQRCFEALRPVRRHFGYRTAAEFLDFLAHAVGSDGNAELERAMLDRAVFSKVLPRIRGEESVDMSNALQDLLAITSETELTISRGKIEEMQQRLASHGVTKFWS